MNAMTVSIISDHLNSGWTPPSQNKPIKCTKLQDKYYECIITNLDNTNVCSYWYKSWEMCKKVCGEVDRERDVQIPKPSKPDIPVSTT